MTDIASIGFKADTTDLARAKKSLDSLSVAASGTSKSANTMARIMQQASTSFAGAALGMTKAVAALVNSTNGATAAQKKAANEAVRFTQKIYEETMAQKKLETATRATTAAIQKQSQAFKAASAQNVTTAPFIPAAQTARTRMLTNAEAEAAAGTTRDQMANRFNTGNLAAQFQDIGVTAQMGMSPLLIAMQQGTQLSAILNSMERPIQGLGVALRQILNPLSLLSIGLVGLVAAGIQMVDWAGLAETVLNGVASGLRALIPLVQDSALAVTGLALVLAVLYGGQTLNWLGSVITSFATLAMNATKAGIAMATAWVVGLGPVGWVIASLGAATAAAVLFREKIQEMFGVNVIQSLRDGINKVIGYVLGMAGGIVSVIAEMWQKIKGESDRSLSEAFSSTFNYAQQIDYVQGVSDTVTAGLTIASDKIADWASKVNVPEATKKRGKSDAEKFADVLTEGQNRIATLKAEAEGLNLTGMAVSQLKFETELLNSAKSKDLKLTEAQIGQLKDLAKQMAVLDNQIKEGEFFKDIDKRTKDLQMQRQVVGLNADEVDRLTAYTELLNEATQKNIELTPQFMEKMKASADEIARIKTETRDYAEGLNFAKDVTRGFVGDLRSSLAEGKSLWESFGDALGNVLDKIIDKLLDVGVNLLFSGLGQTSVAQSIFGSIGSILTGSVNTGGASVPAPSPTMAANGGTFTNGIFSSPTLFEFASGGSFGVMGEAGPEAVMPLSRGPDGSLGVSLNDGGVPSGAKPTVNVEVIVNGNASVEQRSSTMSDGSELRQFIINTISQANASGELDASNSGRYGLTPRRTAR